MDVFRVKAHGFLFKRRYQRNAFDSGTEEAHLWEGKFWKFGLFSQFYGINLIKTSMSRPKYEIISNRFKQ